MIGYSIQSPMGQLRARESWNCTKEDYTDSRVFNKLCTSRYIGSEWYYLSKSSDPDWPIKYMQPSHYSVMTMTQNFCDFNQTADFIDNYDFTRATDLAFLVTLIMFRMTSNDFLTSGAPYRKESCRSSSNDKSLSWPFLGRFSISQRLLKACLL